MKNLTALILFALSGAVVAQVKTAPTDVDLRTSYCIEVMQANVSTSERQLRDPQMQDFVATQIAGEKESLQRLRSYLEPKKTFLALEPLLAAKSRAQQDMAQRYQTGLACTEECLGKKIQDYKPGEGTLASCLSTCDKKSPLLVRLNSCKNPNWLPF